MTLAHKLEKGFAIGHGLVMQLVEDKWIMVVSANAVKLQEAVICKLHVSALGGHLGCR